MSELRGVLHPNGHVNSVMRYDATQRAAYPRSGECGWCGQSGKHDLVEVPGHLPDEHGPFTLERGAFMAVDSVEKRARAISHERLVQALFDDDEKARIRSDLGL